jgi:hypothetical protein
LPIISGFSLIKNYGLLPRRNQAARQRAETFRAPAAEPIPLDSVLNQRTMECAALFLFHRIDVVRTAPAQTGSAHERAPTGENNK